MPVRAQRVGPRSRGAVCLVGQLALIASGCGAADAEETSQSASPVECDGSFDAYAAGMAKTATPGELTVELLNSEPAPPALRDNVWIIRVTDASGQGVTATSVTATPYMPKHNHGSSQVVVEEIGQGEYQLDPVEFLMPGVWEIVIGVTQDALQSEALFTFCIPEL